MFGPFKTGQKNLTLIGGLYKLYPFTSLVLEDALSVQQRLSLYYLKIHFLPLTQEQNFIILVHTEIDGKFQTGEFNPFSIWSLT